ncbi:MAG: SUMF1/EgtB/PvdO family nonheme iron enzyme [Ilumatobacteraceae bacterium]
MSTGLGGEHPPPSSRRAFLAAAAAASAVLAGCDWSSVQAFALDGATAGAIDGSATASTSAQRGPAAGASTIAADMIAVDAAPSFAFATNVTNRGSGEASPIAAPYWLARHMVTNQQWAEFCAATGSSVPNYWKSGSFPTGKEAHPVLAISATAAAAFCDWLSSVAGWQFRLPTEAEWEHAARGSLQTVYPWGANAGSSYSGGVLSTRYNYNAVVGAYALSNFSQATYDSRSSLTGQTVALADVLSIGTNGEVGGWIDHDDDTGFVFTDVYDALAADGGWTTPVGQYGEGVSSTGLFDMAGNAWDWTSSTITAANGAEFGKQVLAVRGGSWYATSRSCTTTYRGEGRDPAGAYSTVGMRVAGTPA